MFVHPYVGIDRYINIATYLSNRSRKVSDLGGGYVYMLWCQLQCNF